MPTTLPKTSRVWRDDSERFPNDMLLRRLGYVIVKRPKRGEAIWRLRFIDGSYGPDELESVILARIDAAEEGERRKKTKVRR